MNWKSKLLSWNIILTVLILITFWIIDYNLNLWELHFLVFYLWSLYAFVVLAILNLLISMVFYAKKQKEKWLIFIKYWFSIPFISWILLLIIAYIYQIISK